MYGMKRFYISASGAIQGHRGPLVVVIVGLAIYHLSYNYFLLSYIYFLSLETCMIKESVIVARIAFNTAIVQTYQLVPFLQ